MERMASCTIPPPDAYPDEEVEAEGVEEEDVVRDQVHEKTTSSTTPLMDITAFGASGVLYRLGRTLVFLRTILASFNKDDSMSSGSKTKCSAKAFAMFSAKMARGPLAKDLIEFVKEANMVIVTSYKFHDQ